MQLNQGVLTRLAQAEKTIWASYLAHLLIPWLDKEPPSSKDGEDANNRLCWAVTFIAFPVKQMLPWAQAD